MTVETRNLNLNAETQSPQRSAEGKRHARSKKAQIFFAFLCVLCVSAFNPGLFLSFGLRASDFGFFAPSPPWVSLPPLPKLPFPTGPRN